VYVAEDDADVNNIGRGGKPSLQAMKCAPSLVGGAYCRFRRRTKLNGDEVMAGCGFGQGVRGTRAGCTAGTAECLFLT